MENEILNIEWHTVRLILKALNNSNTVVQAGIKLGICERSIYRNMYTYDITLDRASKQYICNNVPKYEIMPVKDGKRRDNKKVARISRF